MIMSAHLAEGRIRSLRKENRHLLWRLLLGQTQTARPCARVHRNRLPWTDGDGQTAIVRDPESTNKNGISVNCDDNKCLHVRLSATSAHIGHAFEDVAVRPTGQTRRESLAPFGICVVDGYKPERAWMPRVLAPPLEGREWVCTARKGDLLGR